MPGLENLTAADREQLAASGIPLAEAERQLALLAGAPHAASALQPTHLLRPATVGDGIERIVEEEVPGLLARAREAQARGRFLKFVPASGAASRMFRSLAAVAERFPGGNRQEIETAAAQGDTEAREVADLCRILPSMALGQALAERLQGRLHRIADATTAASLSPLFELFFSTSDGSPAAAALPKALLPFHWAGDRPRTAFVEQLAEGRHYLKDTDGTSRFHFTVGSESRAYFDSALEGARSYFARQGEELEVSFSEQRPSTHALALDAQGRPARTADGRLLLRPAGHGALLGNLAATGGDLVFVKNIDNLLPGSRHAAVAHWKWLLAGKLLELQAERGGDAPWRVCGVVVNGGEPGGGPFWVEGVDGRASLQIVEAAEVATGDPAQAELLRTSTHFNPVDLVVTLRDPAGAPWELERFVDPTRALVAEKSEAGRRLRIYERPGLWNGAMAGWNTVFVEVPAWTFAPVKTILDLARPEHLG
ncbi:MAG: DUF4301 family protein [Thermoanaerobaculia bacterium]